jgi:putative transposase
VDAVRKGTLPRLASEYYRGLAYVHWTLTIEQRATGWLTPQFHHHWERTMLHACARYDLICPIYVLMPDHIHFLWLGVNERGSDQRVAVEFVRHHLRSQLAPCTWQHRSHDNVLRAADRDHAALAATVTYILNNPVRAGLQSQWQNYPYIGNVVPGYPSVPISEERYWDVFWRIYARRVAQS